MSKLPQGSHSSDDYFISQVVSAVDSGDFVRGLAILQKTLGPALEEKTPKGLAEVKISMAAPSARMKFFSMTTLVSTKIEKWVSFVTHPLIGYKAVFSVGASGGTECSADSKESSSALLDIKELLKKAYKPLLPEIQEHILWVINSLLCFIPEGNTDFKLERCMLMMKLIPLVHRATLTRYKYPMEMPDYYGKPQPTRYHSTYTMLIMQYSKQFKEFFAYLLKNQLIDPNTTRAGSNLIGDIPLYMVAVLLGHLERMDVFHSPKVVERLQSCQEAFTALIDHGAVPIALLDCAEQRFKTGEWKEQHPAEVYEGIAPEIRDLMNTKCREYTGDVIAFLRLILINDLAVMALSFLVGDRMVNEAVSKIIKANSKPGDRVITTMFVKNGVVELNFAPVYSPSGSALLRAPSASASTAEELPISTTSLTLEASS